LKGLDPLLGPELLAHLRAMGHADEIAIVDANFPATATARRLVRLDGVSAPRVARAILSVLPLDDFVPRAAFRMEITDAPDRVPPVCGEFDAELRAAGYDRGMEAVERFAFYQRARDAYVIVSTGELRLWGNLLLKKGAIPPGQDA
jgi:L-fucose mutarotase